MPPFFSDDASAYFRGVSSEVVTSDRTLGSLKTPRLSPEEINELLSLKKPKYADRIERLLQDSRAKFDKWMRLLGQDFNIVCFGLGSKR